MILPVLLLIVPLMTVTATTPAVNEVARFHPRGWKEVFRPVQGTTRVILLRRVWRDDEATAELRRRAAPGTAASDEYPRDPNIGSDYSQLEAFLFDYATGEEVWSVRPEGTIHDLLVALTADGCRLLWRDSRAGVRGIGVWDVRTGQFEHSFDGYPEDQPATRIVPLADGRHFITGGAGSVLYWDLQKRVDPQHPDYEFEFALEEHEHLITTVAVSPDETRAVSADSRGNIIVWDLENRKSLRRMYLPHSREGEVDGGWNYVVATGEPIFIKFQGATIDRMAFLPDNRRVVVCTDESLVVVLDTETGAELARFREQKAADGPAYDPEWHPFGGMAVSPDGKCILVGTSYRWTEHSDYSMPYTLSTRFRLLDADSGEVLHTFFGPSVIQEQSGTGGASLRGLTFAPDGRQVAAGFSDGTIRIYDLPQSE